MEDTASLTLGKRILYHRKRLGLTQDQLAEKMGVTAQAVSKWEHDLSCPDVTAVPRLAELFGISTDELLGVPRAAEEPRKSHVGEVVEEVIQDADESGFHLNLQDSGIWFALFLILTGVTYIAAIYLELDVWLWSVAWPSALLCLGLSSCTSHLSAFGLGASAAGLYFLLVNLGVIPSLITWPLVLGLLLILWGISMVFDRVSWRKHRKKRRPHVTEMELLSTVRTKHGGPMSIIPVTSGGTLPFAPTGSRSRRRSFRAATSLWPLAAWCWISPAANRLSRTAGCVLTLPLATW